MSKKFPPPNIVELPVKDLYIPAYYKELFPLKRDRTALTASIMRRSFLVEHAIVVRLKPGSRGEYEIVAGIGRWEVMHDLEREIIPSIVKEMTDAEARAYTAYDNLQASSTSSPLSVVQAIVVALDYAEQSKTRYNPKLVLLAAHTSTATHRRAKESLDHALDVLRGGICKDIADASVAKIIAESVKYAKTKTVKEFEKQKQIDVEERSNHSQSDNAEVGSRSRWIDFENFYAGEYPVKSFKDKYYSRSERAAQHRREQHIMVNALSGKRNVISSQPTSLPSMHPVVTEVENAPVDIEKLIGKLTEVETFALVARLAADLSPMMIGGKGLLPEFAEILRAANFDTNNTHDFCQTLAKHLKPPSKIATPATPSLFDSTLPLLSENANP